MNKNNLIIEKRIVKVPGWLSQLYVQLFNFSSDHDPGVSGFSPAWSSWGSTLSTECAWDALSLSLSLPLTHPIHPHLCAHSISLKEKGEKKELWRSGWGEVIVYEKLHLILDIRKRVGNHKEEKLTGQMEFWGAQWGLPPWKTEDLQ